MISRPSISRTSTLFSTDNTKFLQLSSKHIVEGFKWVESKDTNGFYSYLEQCVNRILKQKLFCMDNYQLVSETIDDNQLVYAKVTNNQICISYEPITGDDVYRFVSCGFPKNFQFKGFKHDLDRMLRGGIQRVGFICSHPVIDGNLIGVDQTGYQLFKKYSKSVEIVSLVHSDGQFYHSTIYDRIPTDRSSDLESSPDRSSDLESSPDKPRITLFGAPKLSGFNLPVAKTPCIGIQDSEISGFQPEFDNGDYPEIKDKYRLGNVLFLKSCEIENDCWAVISTLK